MDPNRVIIFDTTLRDGEQSPGISLNATEKLEIAQQLARLGVDVIEAGFPIASPGDFQAVRTIAREVHGPIIAGLARAHAADIERAAEAVRDAERPRVHTFISTSDIHIKHQLQSTREDVLGQARAAVAHARSLVEDVEFSPMDATRADVEFTAEVLQAAIDEGATTINIPDTVGYAMPNEYAAFLARLYELVPDLRNVVLSRALPRRPGAGGGQLVRRPAGGRAPGRVRDQRPRRARGQRLARGDRDAAAHPRGRHRPHDRHQHARDRPHQPPGLAPDRLRACSRTRRSWAATRSSTSPASTRTACSRSARPTRSWPPRRSASTTRNSIVLGKHSGRHALQSALMELGYDGLRPDAQPGVQALQGDRGQEEAGDRDGPGGAGHRRAPRRRARLHARVVRRRGLDAPPAARDRLDHHARRRERPRRLHRRRPDRRDLPRHQRRHPARGAPARVPHRRGDRRPGRARRGRA